MEATLPDLTFGMQIAVPKLAARNSSWCAPALRLPFAARHYASAGLGPAFPARKLSAGWTLLRSGRQGSGNEPACGPFNRQEDEPLRPTHQTRTRNACDRRAVGRDLGRR